MPALTDFNLAALREQFAAWGFPAAHADRLLRVYYAGAGEAELSAIRPSLPVRLVERLGRELRMRRSRAIARRQSADGTVKFLLGFDAKDGSGPAPGTAETVLMPAFRPDRAAGCVSSQVGCAMGCDFCASTRRGLERHLDPGEIVEQFLTLKREAMSQNRRLASLVYMGMGEPLHNYDNVVESIRRIAGHGMGELGGRQITVSTVGLVPGMDRLGEAGLNVHLALSLHAPDDETRAKLVPSNRRYPVAEIMAALRRFERRTGRPPTVEYTLLAGVNDSDAQAALLAELMSGFRAHVNLIPYNPIGGAGLSGAIYRRPDAAAVSRFLGLLRDAGVIAHVRVTRGDDVDAACGQLRQLVTLR